MGRKQERKAKRTMEDLGRYLEQNKEFIYNIAANRDITGDDLKNIISIVSNTVKYKYEIKGLRWCLKFDLNEIDRQLIKSRIATLQGTNIKESECTPLIEDEWI